VKSSTAYHYTDGNGMVVYRYENSEGAEVYIWCKAHCPNVMVKTKDDRIVDPATFEWRDVRQYFFRFLDEADHTMFVLRWQ